jgi:putative transposase
LRAADVENGKHAGVTQGKSAELHELRKRNPLLKQDDKALRRAVICQVLGFSTQVFYKWKRGPVSRRDWDDAQVTNAAVDPHADDPEFGYRLIADEVRHAGHRVSENRVHRLRAQQRLWSVHARRRG